MNFGTKAALDIKAIKDIRVAAEFIHTYCRQNHREAERLPFGSSETSEFAGLRKKYVLCGECAELLDYGIKRRIHCPYDPKPMCKKCPTHCYRKDYRAKMKEVMKFSGIHLIKRGRLDLLYHYYC